MANSTVTLVIVTGQSGTDVSHNVFANLGWDEVRLPQPVFEGDTIYAQSEVLTLRESTNQADVGVVTVRTVGFNQDAATVITFRHTLLVYKQGRGPRLSVPSLEGHESP